MGLNFSYVLVIEPNAEEQLLSRIGANRKVVGLDFPLDDVLRAYLLDDAERTAKSNGSGPDNESQYRQYFPNDLTGRVDYIELETKLDRVSGQLYVSFDAVTSRMSRLFQQSDSIQKWFVELGRSVRATSVFLYQEAEGYRFMLLQGQVIDVELPAILDFIAPSTPDESLLLNIGLGFDRLFLI